MKWKLILILMLLSGNMYVEGQNDLESTATEYLREGETLSKSIILSDEENTYTVFFYMEEDEFKGAIVFQNETVVMDADLYERILEFSLIFKYSDFEQLVSQYNSFEEKKKEMAKYLKDFEEAFHFDISTGEKISMMENRDYARYYRKTKSDYNDFSENFIFSIKDYVTNAEEGDISSISFLLENKEEILKSLDSLEDSYIKFTRYEFKLMEIELELLVKNLMELLTILSGEQVTTGEQATIDITLEKEIIEKEQKEFKEKIAYFKDSLESLVPAFLAEKVEELIYDFFATRVPPEIALEIETPEKTKIGGSINIICIVKNAGKTYADDVDLIFRFSMDLAEDTVIEGIGESSSVIFVEKIIRYFLKRHT
ncbi:MAG: hypothetical protein ACE5K0_07040 [Candidatus Methanofastidiosia archaeon]